MKNDQTVPPPSVVVLGPEDHRERAEKRALSKAETEEFVKKWEAERLARVEAGKDEMAMQVSDMTAAYLQHRGHGNGFASRTTVYLLYRYVHLHLQARYCTSKLSFGATSQRFSTFICTARSTYRWVPTCVWFRSHLISWHLVSNWRRSSTI